MLGSESTRVLQLRVFQAGNAAGGIFCALYGSVYSLGFRVEGSKP